MCVRPEVEHFDRDSGGSRLVVDGSPLRVVFYLGLYDPQRDDGLPIIPRRELQGHGPRLYVGRCQADRWTGELGRNPALYLCHFAGPQANLCLGLD